MEIIESIQQLLLEDGVNLKLPCLFRRCKCGEATVKANVVVSAEINGKTHAKECKICRAVLKETVCTVPNTFLVCVQAQDTSVDSRSRIYALMRTHFIRAIVQFHPGKKHFRTISRDFATGKMEVSDSTIRSFPIKEWNVHADPCSGWVNYVCTFTAKKPTGKEAKQQALKFAKVVKPFYQGNGDEQEEGKQEKAAIRVLEWNVGRGMYNHELTKFKKKMVVEQKADIVAIIEPQHTFKLSNQHVCFFSLPHTKLQEKVNCCLAVKSGINVQLRRQAINYVSLTAK